MKFAHQKLALWLALLVAPLLVVAVTAQTTPAQELIPGQAFPGTINAQNTARVYTFVGRAGEIINVNATSNAIPLAMLLTDDDGTLLAQSVDREGLGVTRLTNITLPISGTYLVTVFPSPVNLRNPVGEFTVTLILGAIDAEAVTPPSNTVIQATPAEVAEQPTEPVPAPSTVEPTPVLLVTDVPNGPAIGGPAQPTPTAPSATQPTTVASAGATLQPPGQAPVPAGMSVTLNWNAPVDMNLEVRDPLGNPLRFNVRTSPIGGSFGFDANGVCEVIADAPQEVAEWSPGFLPSGSYEILVFYRQACEDVGPVQFTLNVTVDGTPLPPLQGTLSPPLPGEASVYLTNFRLQPDGSASLNRGGVYPDSSLNVLPDTPFNILGNAQPIQRGVPVQGALFEEQVYQAYSFQSNGQENIGVTLTATSGSLDTLLQVVDPNGSLIAVNDDSNGTTNSEIPSLRLATPGTYTVVATRYGKEIGGTEGQFALQITESDTVVPPAITALSPEAGDIAVVLTWLTAADLQLLVRDPLGQPVFDDRQSVPSGGVLIEDGNVNCVRATGTPYSQINWPFGFLRPGTYEIEVWYQNECNDTTPVQFTLAAIVDGQPVLAEQQRPILPQQRFVVSFTVNSDRTATAGPGGFIGGGSSLINFDAEQPEPITIGRPVLGSITQANTFDVYSFEGLAGQIVTVNMGATSQGLDTKLFLIGPEGNEIAENDDADPLLAGTNTRTTDSLISQFILPQTGTYRIIATRFASVFGGTEGNYVLNVQLN